MRQGANLPRDFGVVKDNAATPGEQQPLKAGAVARRSCTGHRASKTSNHPDGIHFEDKAARRSHQRDAPGLGRQAEGRAMPAPPSNAGGAGSTGPWRSR